MSINFRKIVPHLLVIVGFIVAALAYFNPVLQGKVIFQSDITQYIGMSHQNKEFKEDAGEESYWTDAAFGGMPTYQLGADYPYNYIKQLDRTLRFLPRPADYLFLYFIGIYILFLCLKIDYKLAALGALAFGFSTYLVIILGVGHNAKAHAIAYMPIVLAGIILTFRQKYLWGGILFTLAMALEINTNHFQMTYYLLLLVVVLGIAYFIDFFQKKKIKQYFVAIAVMLAGVIIAIGTNATNILATKEYADFSTRGDTGLSITPNGEQQENTNGLSYDYITEYSYGIAETFNLFIPRFMGGSSSEKLGEDSELYNELLKIGASPQQALSFADSAPTYWGNQTFIGAPAYIGAVVIFLFVLALYLVKGRFKWWIVGGSILALLLSWGDNLAPLTKFFINYVPLYNKFRAVSSIQVILELCLPLMAVCGLSKFFGEKRTQQEKEHALKWAAMITGGLALLFLVSKSVFFDFVGNQDRQYLQQLGQSFVRALREDRKAIFNTDTIRSLIFVALAAGLIWAYLKNKVNKSLTIGALALLIVVDLVGVDRRYVNNEDFVQEHQMKKPFQANAADLEILKDEGHYRVLDFSGSPLNSSRASYFHHSLGGYHAAKPGRIQELFDFYIYDANQQVLNMLNTKYIILSNQGEIMAQPNPQTNGNAWFVNDVKFVTNANQEILALDSLNTKQTAVVNKKFSAEIPQQEFATDSTAQIQLKSYQPNQLVYSYSTQKERLALFSEIYYPHGWKAYVEGKEISILQADYVLRAAILPAGSHEITFKFEPEVIKTGSKITIASGVILSILLLGGLVVTFRKKLA
ncbi:YfhO family protein [Mesonia aestuariivivens]|uniref:YfhO family protein n=1 Tax=Mesonia aestuariivivens TaxID=2796128 RepID=A0ABS6VYJ9_9FLAO|nr:YfhO family protein [Mesonia aestuariivivens]MBW2960670.1 YfhO family protein [Mesonia aestuariivivens]